MTALLVLPWLTAATAFALFAAPQLAWRSLVEWVTT